MFTSNDLGLAAFLMLKGHKLHNAYINEKKVFVFEFADPDNKIHQTAIEYLNSDCSMFDTQVKKLKKILYR
jgi:hypothetical protein